jgi:hypothetical protein
VCIHREEAVFVACVRFWVHVAHVFWLVLSSAVSCAQGGAFQSSQSCTFFEYHTGDSSADELGTQSLTMFCLVAIDNEHHRVLHFCARADGDP